MTAPADDCGVTGGCRACPLFAANVCGDPGSETESAAQPNWAALVDAYLTRELARLSPPARFEVDGAGTVTDRDAPPLVICQYGATPHPLDDECQRVTPATLDAPDRDPAEPDLSGCDYYRGKGTCSESPRCRAEPACITDAPPGGWPAQHEAATPDAGPVPVCVQTPSGVVPCGVAVLCRSPEEVTAARTGYRVVRYGGGTVRYIAPDAPDVDPAEPRPDGAGCCGGACGG
ncbi:hypothetical protein [Micromonospora okii]|uniref:hypothetical protein n=1 Tax=Micromonospora okii TaxID=1182970 RepID=UPI001E58BA12|nr:hypothetical protein [Micromonospora okii]